MIQISQILRTKHLTINNFDQILSTFKFTNPKTSNNDCVKAGCSGQLCVEKGGEGIVTHCAVLEEYQCFQYSTCERQPDDNCGWTPTSEFKSCQAKYQ